MIEVLSLIIIFVLLILAVIWGHFLFANRTIESDETLSHQYRENTNVELYHEHKAEIEKDFAEGSIDEESYQYLLAELDKGLLLDIEQSKSTSAELSQERPLGIVWPVILSLFVFAFSLVFYNKYGALEQLSQLPLTPADSQQIQVQQQVEALKKQTDINPQDPETWYALGQSYVGLGQFDSAIAAFDKVIEIEGEHADLYGAKAQALYYREEQNITPDVQILIDKALALDEVDPSTNILLGMHNFTRQNYQQAISYWQKVIDSGRSSVNIEALKEAVGEAKNRVGMTGQPSGNTVDVSGPQLNVSVSISDEILAKLSDGEDKVVFIYAVPAEGGRMPVAAVKMMASDLPADIVLNDSKAMSPQMKLSDVSSVNVYAVVSKLGGAGIKTGDFKAELTDIKVLPNADVDLVIDAEVP